MKFKIADIRANPFRHIERYPYRAEKIVALRESLRTTGFWDNVVARVGEDGHPEIAYGHHRLRALEPEYDPDHEVNLIMRELSDEDMLKIMARENMEEWGTSAAVEHETVRAVVEAYAQGRISLATPSAMARGLRYAPHFREGLSPDRSGDKPYTAMQVGEFLGWMRDSGKTQDKVQDALAALELIEDGVLAESDFNGLTTTQAQAVVRQARQAKQAQEIRARDAAKRAEQEQKNAEDAERRRVAAQQKRKAAEEREAQEKEETAIKREAQRAAREARDAEKRAAEDRKRALLDQAEANNREQRARDEGREQARRTGRHVSEELKGGKRGYKDAGKIADEVRDRPQGPPPHIDDFAMKLAGELNKTLHSDSDERAKKLDVLLKFQSNMTAGSLRELVAVLGVIGDRAEHYRSRLLKSPRHSGGANDASDGDIIDVEDAGEIIGRPALPGGNA